MDGKSIRFGLAAVKNLGKGVIARMVQERRGGGAYTSFYNFCKRMAGREMNRRAIESLVKCGALDSLGNNRREMLLGVESVMNGLEDEKRRNLEGQMGFFDGAGTQDAGSEPALTQAEEFPPQERMAMEKEVTGMYLTGHPMAGFAALYQSGRYARAGDVLLSAGEEPGPGPRYTDGQKVSMLGMVAALRRKATKSGASMAFALIEDMSGAVNALIFPKLLEESGNLLQEGAVVEAAGRLSFQEDKEPELVCDSLAPPPGPEGAPKKKTQRPGLYLRLESKEDPRYR